MKFKELVNAMGSHSLEELPREVCGIIAKDFSYIKCKNISPTPKTSFIVDPYSILKYQNSIWGFFHSHPYSKDPIPSDRDLDMLLFKQYKFIVGFNNNFYIYNINENNKLVFERLNENHCKL
jgi:proteasome lid subunit RPN8/RPN11